MKKSLLFIIAFITLAMTVNANNDNQKTLETEVTEELDIQPSFFLKGKIYDPQCDELISGATITIDGKKYYSDLLGNFSIPELKKGKYKLQIDFISYQPQIMEVELSMNQDINIEIKQQ